jgi:hypothetical protein
MNVLRGGRRRGLVERIMRRLMRRPTSTTSATMASIHPVLKQPWDPRIAEQYRRAVEQGHRREERQ